MALNKETLLAAIETETDLETVKLLQAKLEVAERMEQNKLQQISILQSTKAQMESVKEDNPPTERYSKIVSVLDSLVNSL